MKTPPIPINEYDRLAALRSYGILYTEQEEAYDQITDLATHITDMPTARISFVDVDKVWFKSVKGAHNCNGDRALSFCSYAIGTEGPTFVVNDTQNHSVFKNHPHAIDTVNPVSFYAGICLVDKMGYKLGTLCVIDHRPNHLTDEQLDSLEKLARQVVKLIELHSANDLLNEIQIDLKGKNKELKNFAGVVSHDMKMPLANIILTTDILKAKYEAELDTKAISYLTNLKQSSFTLSDYITGLLDHYESDSLEDHKKETFDIHLLLEDIVELLEINVDCEINFPEINIDISCNRAALEQIFLNLLANSLKFNDKDKIIIDIEVVNTNDSYLFKVSDNGIGIPADKQGEIFDLFSTVGNLDRNGQQGSGIGLSTVKKIIASLDGEITVSSEIGKSTTFEFIIKN